MSYIIACLMASLSFLVNRAMLRFIGPQVIVSFSPVFEEAAKTLLAYLLNADILITHVTFGLLEAGYDWSQHSRHRLAAAALSIIGHSLFGWLTVIILKISGSIMLGLSGAVVAHLIWNVIAVRISAL